MASCLLVKVSPKLTLRIRRRQQKTLKRSLLVGDSNDLTPKKRASNVKEALEKEVFPEMKGNQMNLNQLYLNKF